MSILELSFESGESSLSVRQFRVEEGMNDPFQVSITARSSNEQLDLDDLVGRAATFKMVSGTAGLTQSLRTWTGIVSRMELTRVEDAASGLSTYELTIVPNLWLLGRRRNNRLFQHIPIPDILEKLLAEWQVRATFRIARDQYLPVELRFQWDETDLAFFQRLAEEAGISFFFEDDSQFGSVLVLSDAPHTTPPRAAIPFVDSPGQAQAGQLEYVTQVRLVREVKPGLFTHRDFDFRNPRFPLFGRAESDDPIENRYDQYVYRPSTFNMEASPDKTEQQKAAGGTPTADDKGVARFRKETGEAIAARTLEAARAPRKVVRFVTNTVDPSPGRVVAFSSHPRGDIDEKPLLIIGFSLTGATGEEWKMEGSAVFASMPYRPPLVSPKPRVFGIQSAIVVGPPGEEIYVDEFGRVRVQFHWDREGKMDPLSSIWMRVSQGWAGARYGMMVIPRIGHEVLVAFLDGDPDSPLIVGRAYNASEPVPYLLPENKTVSTWKSDSSPGGDGYNEIKYEDKKHHELIYLQAEKDMGRLIKNDEVTMVGHDRTKVVEHDEIISVKNDRVKVVQHDESVAVGQDRSTQVRRDDAVATGRDRTDFVMRDRMVATGVNVAETVGVSRRTRVGAKELLEVGERYLVRVAPGLGERMAKGLGSALEVPALGKMLGAAIGWSSSALESGTLSGLMSGLLRDSYGATPLPSFIRAPLDALSPVIPQKVQAVLNLTKAPTERADAAGNVPGTPDQPTQIEMVNKRITLTTGDASITLDGPDIHIQAQGKITMTAQGKVTVRSVGDDVEVLGGPRILLNPPGENDAIAENDEPPPDEIA
ncbi:MAG: type VI secretion system tip protein VgrG [Polyangiaceae bacterium]|nr:type VI secretion system tip protein VgrG [Polyangiaceae bacterium]